MEVSLFELKLSCKGNKSKFQSLQRLDLVNFTLADVRNGIGPFLGIYRILALQPLQASVYLFVMVFPSKNSQIVGLC
ncbi:hypothetical protein FEM55_15035 [Dyadobacter sediminis]|uniref:Uncharacterized protein n=1 Tax=Dyadobacter sediminis TaxID=1493691 RepID=A0A5R9KBC3_9BACT|nr:hypothetical protein FEM55_15035 [Dyadobacter sediminis]